MTPRAVQTILSISFLWGRTVLASLFKHHCTKFRIWLAFSTSPQSTSLWARQHLPQNRFFGVLSSSVWRGQLRNPKRTWSSFLEGQPGFMNQIVSCWAIVDSLWYGLQIIFLYREPLHHSIPGRKECSPFLNLQGTAWVDVPGFIWFYHNLRLGVASPRQATRITGTLVLKLDEAAQIADPRSFFTVNVVFFVAASLKNELETSGELWLASPRNCWNQYEPGTNSWLGILNLSWSLLQLLYVSILLGLNRQVFGQCWLQALRTVEGAVGQTPLQSS